MIRRKLGHDRSATGLSLKAASHRNRANRSTTGFGLRHSNNIIQLNRTARRGGLYGSRASAHMNGAPSGIELHVRSRADHERAAFRRRNHLAARRADLDGSATRFHPDISTHFANSDVAAAAGSNDRSIDLIQLDSTTLRFQLHQRRLHRHEDIEVQRHISYSHSLAADHRGFTRRRGNNLQSGQFPPRRLFRFGPNAFMNDVGDGVLLGPLKVNGPRFGLDTDSLVRRQRTCNLFDPLTPGTVNAGGRFFSYRPETGADQNSSELEKPEVHIRVF